MSPRTLARRFRDATGTTPMRWLTHRRIAHAQQLLVTTDLPIETLAHRTGTGTAANLRQHFRTAPLPRRPPTGAATATPPAASTSPHTAS